MKGKKDYLEDLGIDRRIILRWIMGKWWKGVVWMHLAYKVDKLQAVVNTVTNLWVA
jgi:hypothetical protein